MKCVGHKMICNIECNLKMVYNSLLAHTTIQPNKFDLYITRINKVASINT